MFDFHGEDITEDEDGGIVRRIITKGEGYSKPNEGASVEGNKHTHTHEISALKRIRYVFNEVIGVCLVFVVLIYWAGCVFIIPVRS